MGELMAKKTSNLKIVEQPTEAERAAKERAGKQREIEEKSWRLNRFEITARVRALRAELEEYRTRLEGMPFDAGTSGGVAPPSLGYDGHEPDQLAEAVNPCIAGRYERLEKAIPADCQDDLSELKWAMAETSFHNGVLAGAIFAGCPDREIDRLERGLIHAIASRGWRCNE